MTSRIRHEHLTWSSVGRSRACDGVEVGAGRCGHISTVISTVLNAYYASFADVAGPARMGAH